MKRNKAQATIFMIIGIIILIALGTYLYIKEKSLKEEITPGVKITLEKVPREFDPLKSFVTNCLEDASIKGLELIGKQGGYVSLEPEYSGQAFSLSNEPTNADAVEFAPDSGLRIPYWYYLSSSNDCVECRFESKRPKLIEGENSIQTQLSRYVENNLDECLDNFNALKEQGYIIEAKNKKVETTIAENDVAVVLNYDLEAQKGSTKASISQFYVVLPVSLKKVYNLATRITNFEMQNRFLEKAAINLIASFAGIDKEKLPPVADTRFQFGSTTNWIKTDVKNKVSEILLSYIPLFQVFNTRNYNRNIFASDLKQGLYDDFIVPLTNESYPNLEASFTYLDFWPIYFDLNCNGEFCQPESASSDILPIGIQRYDFVYDVSFPTYVEINEPDALNGRGYTFGFFLEGNLRNNKPLPLKATSLQAATLSFGSQLCDLGNRNSADVTVNVKDKATKNPLDDVQIAYTVTGETCFIGSTNENGSLTAEFPIAIGGVVHFIKTDYLKKALQFDAGPKEEIINARLEPIKTMNVVIKKKKLVKTASGWELRNKPADLDEKEEAIIALTRNSPLQDEEYATAATYSLNQKEPSEIRIAPGSYEATIDVLLKDRLVIPEKTVKIDGGWFAEDQEYTIPAIKFSKDQPFPSGGLRLNVTIIQADLEKYDTIVFYVVSIALQDIPEASRTIEDFEETSRVDHYSDVYQFALKPTFQ